MSNNYAAGQNDVRPWGEWTVLDAGPGYVVKRIRVTPGGILSLQRHRHRAEEWTVVTGVARVTLGQRQFDLPPANPCISTQATSTELRTAAWKTLSLSKSRPARSCRKMTSSALRTATAGARSVCSPPDNARGNQGPRMQRLMTVTARAVYSSHFTTHRFHYPNASPNSPCVCKRNDHAALGVRETGPPT